jgi:hypothetical protein
LPNGLLVIPLILGDGGLLFGAGHNFRHLVAVTAEDVIRTALTAGAGVD